MTCSIVTAPKLTCIVLYCIGLYWFVLVCIGLYCIVLYCIVLYCKNKHDSIKIGQLLVYCSGSGCWAGHRYPSGDPHLCVRDLLLL